MTLNLVKGEFSSLEEALRAQVKALEAELTELKTHTTIPHGEKQLDPDAGTRADYWEHLYKEADAKRDLLTKYWLLWTPVQFATFGVVPPQYRIAFIAVVSFFWLIVLSTISSRDDNSKQE